VAKVALKVDNEEEAKEFNAVDAQTRTDISFDVFALSFFQELFDDAMREAVDEEAEEEADEEEEDEETYKKSEK
jgi:hypothetical protein